MVTSVIEAASKIGAARGLHCHTLHRGLGEMLYSDSAGESGNLPDANSRGAAECVERGEDCGFGKVNRLGAGRSYESRLDAGDAVVLNRNRDLVRGARSIDQAAGMDDDVFGGSDRRDRTSLRVQVLPP
jgi:hypothetical protein